jgi:conserved oligomeric Golgi complex subunit 3
VQKATRLATQTTISQSQQEWRQSIAEELDQEFRRACEGELREHMTRLKLYLEDSPALAAIIKHILDKITDCYSAFRHVALNTYIAIPREVLPSSAGLTEYLKAVCDHKSSGPEP